MEPVLRFGVALIPSPLVSQEVGTAFLDSDRLLATLGAGIQHDDPLGLVPGPVRWDFFYTRTKLAEGQLEIADSQSQRPGAPVDGQPIPIGGTLWSAGAQMTVSF